MVHTVTGKSPGGFRVGRVESSKVFIEKASQLRRQGAYKHSNPVL